MTVKVTNELLGRCGGLARYGKTSANSRYFSGAGRGNPAAEMVLFLAAFYHKCSFIVDAVGLPDLPEEIVIGNCILHDRVADCLRRFMLVFLHDSLNLSPVPLVAPVVNSISVRKRISPLPINVISDRSEDVS